MSDLYQETIIEEFKYPRNKGLLVDADQVLHGENASCGDELTIYLKLNQDGHVTQLQWEGNGCAISQAAMSLLSNYILQHHLTLIQVQQLEKETLLDLLGLDEINPGREKCLMIALKTLKKAVGRGRNDSL